MQLRLGGANKVSPLVQTRFAERNADISPDGRWLAYEANDSGQFEIYVTPFPDSGGRSLVSTNGGRQPLWARGRTGQQELFYLERADALMRVGVMPGATWAATVPEKLFDVARYYTGSTVSPYGRMYDVAPDGDRFLMIKPGGAESDDAVGADQSRRHPAFRRRAEATCYWTMKLQISDCRFHIVIGDSPR